MNWTHSPHKSCFFQHKEIEIPTLMTPVSYDNSIHNSWWRHQMETFSKLLALCAGNSLVTGEFPTQRPVTRSFDVFFICTWINHWVNSREAGYMKHHHAHYDVIVIITFIIAVWQVRLMIHIPSIPCHISEEKISVQNNTGYISKWLV